MPKEAPRWLNWVKQLGWLDWLGHAGYISLLAGVWLVGGKVSWGWGLYVLGCGSWIYIGFKLKMTSVWIWQTVATLNALWAWWRW